jgi:hypothetical protein
LILKGLEFYFDGRDGGPDDWETHALISSYVLARGGSRLGKHSGKVKLAEEGFENLSEAGNAACLRSTSDQAGSRRDREVDLVEGCGRCRVCRRAWFDAQGRFLSGNQLNCLHTFDEDSSPSRIT